MNKDFYKEDLDKRKKAFSDKALEKHDAMEIEKQQGRDCFVEHVLPHLSIHAIRRSFCTAQHSHIVILDVKIPIMMTQYPSSAPNTCHHIGFKGAVQDWIDRNMCRYIKDWYVDTLDKGLTKQEERWINFRDKWGISYKPRPTVSAIVLKF